jgi:cell division protein FtsB
MTKPATRKRKTQFRSMLQDLNRKKRTRQLIWLGILIIVLLFIASGPRGTVQLVTFMNQKQDLEEEIRGLEAKKKELEALKEKIEKDPDYIEKIAREKYKMRKKDEKVYQIIEEDK